MIDFAAQRANMVESQVRPSDVTDRRILRAMRDVPRETFLPEALRPLAYMDQDVPLATGRDSHPARALIAPRVLAKLIQLLELADDHAVLDVGGATGYAAAVLARLAGRVVAVECDADLADAARHSQPAAANAPVQVVTGALADGFAAEAPYDAILLNGSVPDVPDTLLYQLKDGGRLAAVVADGRLGKARLWRRTGGTFDSREAFDATAAALPGFARAPVFQF